MVAAAALMAMVAAGKGATVAAPMEVTAAGVTVAAKMVVHTTVEENVILLTQEHPAYMYLPFDVGQRIFKNHILVHPT